MKKQEALQTALIITARRKATGLPAAFIAEAHSAFLAAVSELDDEADVSEAWDSFIASLNHPSHGAQREAAIQRINQAHARFMRALTGNATIEERDTWKIKEEVARAYLLNTATEGQSMMIELEAQGDGTEPTVLAQIIVAKFERFQKLIGMAAGLKNKAKAAIVQATDEAVPIEHVGSVLEQVFAQVEAETQTAIEAWSSGSA